MTSKQSPSSEVSSLAFIRDDKFNLPGIDMSHERDREDTEVIHAKTRDEIDSLFNQ